MSTLLTRICVALLLLLPRSVTSFTVPHTSLMRLPPQQLVPQHHQAPPPLRLDMMPHNPLDLSTVWLASNEWTNAALQFPRASTSTTNPEEAAAVVTSTAASSSGVSWPLVIGGGLVLLLIVVPFLVAIAISSTVSNFLDTSPALDAEYKRCLVEELGIDADSTDELDDDDLSRLSDEEGGAMSLLPRVFLKVGFPDVYQAAVEKHGQKTFDTNQDLVWQTFVGTVTQVMVDESGDMWNQALERFQQLPQSPESNVTTVVTPEGEPVVDPDDMKNDGTTNK